MQGVSKDVALALYEVLVTECKACAADADSFVYEFTKRDDPYGPTQEWRFQGALGFGGKFRYPRCTVDCYRENETPETLAMIASANKKLAELKALHNITGMA